MSDEEREQDEPSEPAKEEAVAEPKPRPKKKKAPRASASGKDVTKDAADAPIVAAPAPTAPATPTPSPPVWSILAQVAFVVAAAVGVYAYVSTGRDGEARRRCAPTCLMKPDYAAYERKAADFALPNMKGEIVHLSDFKGKVVVMNFWTKTCGPCMQEMPDIAELAKILQKYDDVAVVTVSIDDGPDDVRDTLKALLREDPPFPVLFDPDDKIVREVYGTRLFPETWIIDKDGVIRARFDGAREWNSSAAVELVDQIRSGGFCPLEVKGSETRSNGTRLCETLTGG